MSKYRANKNISMKKQQQKLTEELVKTTHCKYTSLVSEGYVSLLCWVRSESPKPHSSKQNFRRIPAIFFLR